MSDTNQGFNFVGGPVIPEEPAQEVTETAAQEPQAPPKEETPDPFAPKFAALSRREKAIRDRERKLQAEMEALKQSRGSVDKEQSEWKSKYEQLVSKLQSSPTEGFKEIGKSWDDIVETALNEQNPSVEFKLKKLEESYQQRVAQLEARLEEFNKKTEEEKQNREQEEINMVISRTKESIASLVNSNDKYELLRSEGESGVEAVMDALRQHFEETGEVLEISDLADAMEAQLEEEITKRLQLNKVKSKLGTQAPAKQSKTETAPTLSNDLAQQSPTSSKGMMTEEERQERAAKLIRWNR